jgi:hypothetical protein
MSQFRFFRPILYRLNLPPSPGVAPDRRVQRTYGGASLKALYPAAFGRENALAMAMEPL